MRSISVIFLLVLSACASSSGGSRPGVNSDNGTWRMPEASDEGSHARPAAYGAEAFMFRKDQPNHSNPRPWDFYYKHCAMNGEDTVYSATSYSCAGPSF